MSRRPKPVAPAAAGEGVDHARRPGLAVPIAIGWLLVFAAHFFGALLQNNRVLRGDLLLIVPDLLLVNLFAPYEPGLPSGLRFLPQRFDLIAVAVVIWAGAWAGGSLLLRALGRLPGGTALAGLPSIERGVFALGLGLSAWSLTTLLLGLAGMLSRPLFALVLLSAIVAEVTLRVRARSTRGGETASDVPRGSLFACGVVIVPFVLLAGLAAMLPPFDFDVREYHLGGPKEFYLDGRIHFLPHNVYTSFPFLTEMLSLSAMVLRGDWYRGALAGQLVLFGFYPLTAAAVFALGRRLFGTAAGLAAAVVYVTTPWAYRIGVIAYAEGGLTAYTALATLAAAVAIRRVREGAGATAAVALAGLFAGSAMTCKYPGVLQVVVPIGVALLVAAWLRRAGGVSLPVRDLRERVQETSDAAGHPLTPDPSPQGERDRTRRLLRVGFAFAVGVLLSVGSWLAKNAVETGNPVYPLLWTVFGGRDWDAELNAKWRAGHSPPGYSAAGLLRDLNDLTTASDWQSVLVFALAPLALVGRNRAAAAGLWAYLAFLVLAWWLLTHRIDRFWVPLLPVACVLAGAGAAWTAAPAWRIACGLLFAVAVAFNFAVVTSPLTGDNSYLADLDALGEIRESPGIAILNDSLPPDAKALLVGEAQIFDARFRYEYNTVFDRSLFERYAADPRPGVPPGKWPLRPPEEVRETLRDRGITHVYVNWREILRYRTTYGFTPFVTPERFDALVAGGVLGEPMVLQTTPLDALGGAERSEAVGRFAGRLRGSGERRTFVADELYPVRPAAGQVSAGK